MTSRLFGAFCGYLLSGPIVGIACAYGTCVWIPVCQAGGHDHRSDKGSILGYRLQWSAQLCDTAGYGMESNMGDRSHADWSTR